MTFRRERTDARERAWPAWVQEHREALSSLGLPLETYVDSWSWDQFAESGEVYAPKGQDVSHGFHFSQLRPGKMNALLTFLEQTDEFRPENSSLLGFLRVRVSDQSTG